MLFAAVEGGGTTWVAAIAKDLPYNIIEKVEFVTSSPEETLGKVSAWLHSRKFDAIGVAVFGPVDANTSSKWFGHITSTPKRGIY